MSGLYINGLKTFGFKANCCCRITFDWKLCAKLQTCMCHAHAHHSVPACLPAAPESSGRAVHDGGKHVVVLKFSPAQTSCSLFNMNHDCMHACMHARHTPSQDCYDKRTFERLHINFAQQGLVLACRSCTCACVHDFFKQTSHTCLGRVGSGHICVPAWGGARAAGVACGWAFGCCSGDLSQLCEKSP